uniref:Uncharacterized protein n=1 Tax=Leersia perrieri TaxID=77586 RepID=A0A0D9VM59_9ORYZ
MAAGKPESLDYGDLLSRMPRSGSATDYVLRQVVYELRNARRYEQALEISSSLDSPLYPLKFSIGCLII